MFEYLNIFFLETYKILFLLLPVLTAVALMVWLDRRVWAFVQKRRGPNVVGPFGLFQSLADALKYLFKEIIIPASSNRSLSTSSPFLPITMPGRAVCIDMRAVCAGRSISIRLTEA